MSNLTILNTQVATHGNLYSLNDLHRLSGSEAKHRPNQFIRLDTTKDLIVEMESENQPRTDILIVKNGLGSYACEELVLAYAMWISPKFHLIVLRAFLAMHRNEPKQLALPEPEKKFRFEFTPDDIHNLVWLLFSHGQMNWLLGRLMKPLEAIGSSFSAAVCGNHYEYKRHYRDCLPLIQQLIAPLKQTHPQEWQALQHRLNDN